MADKKKTNTPAPSQAAPKQSAGKGQIRKDPEPRPRQRTHRMDSWTDGVGECAGAD